MDERRTKTTLMFVPIFSGQSNKASKIVFYESGVVKYNRTGFIRLITDLSGIKHFLCLGIPTMDFLFLTADLCRRRRPLF